MINVVLFDVDGVLLDSFEANLKFYRDLALRTGYPPPSREEHRKTFHLPLWDKIKHITGLTEESEIQHIFDIAKSNEIPYDLSLVRTPKGLETTITALRAKHVLGIVTSRIRARVFVSPDFEKLSPHFSTVVAYEDTENHKPHPEPLLCAAIHLGVEPNTCVYIGDVENDMKAAHAAGMKGVHLTQSKKHFGDARLASFRDLPAILADW